MDEYIELLDSNNKTTGEKCLKSVAHKNGYYHASVHIWFYTKKGEILIQKRKENKDTFPSLWDVSVAGHITFGESPLLAAIRETKEEIGLTINGNQLKNIGTSSHKNIHSEKLIDHELHHIYVSLLEIDIRYLSIQKEEVSEIKLISIDAFKMELKNNTDSYVPHGSDYYTSVFEAIEKRY